MTRRRIYILLFFGSITGWLWVIFQLYYSASTPTVCLFKQVTTIPCPSCGSTRAVMEIVQGHFLLAIYWNPLAIITFAIMAISPFWIFADWITKKETLYRTYIKTEEVVRRRWIAIPLILLVLANWVWNIQKGL